MTASGTQRSSRPKVVVAMSGGVDSSVSACLLCEQRYDVIGLFMRVGAELPEPPACASPGAARPHQGCCSAADAADARFVAGQLGIPFYALNFKDDFDRIIDYFADEYLNGRTPNPCVQCNTWLKFGKLIDYADAVGAEFVATGHYARITRRDGRTFLRRGRDEQKDQSYFLFGVRPETLERAMFPVGNLTKTQVRAEAQRFNLPVTDKPDSVEICFAPDRDYARVVHARRPQAFQAGEVVDTAGRVLGTHDGIANFTIGQRRGLGIAAGRPVYVTSLDVANNRVVLGERADLLSRSLVANEANFFCPPPVEPIRCAAKIRYQHAAAPCSAHVDDAGLLHVVFDEPQSAVTPGQAVVLYEDDTLLGGGWIAHASP